jgi:hypothetical protein
MGGVIAARIIGIVPISLNNYLMQTLRFTSGLLLAASLFIASCAKEKDQTTPTALPDYTIEKGMIHFTTRGDYEAMVNMPSVALQEAFVNAVRQSNEFTSAEKALEVGSRSTDSDLLAMIDDPYFRELLNERLCIWIDDHIFRVNPEDGKVYVIPSAMYEEKYGALLAEDTEDEDVKEYSADLNVLEEVDRPDALWPFCSESGVPSQYAQVYLNDNSGRYASARYAKYGIYFTVLARVEPQGSSGVFFHFYFRGGVSEEEGYVYYRQKCGNTVSYQARSEGTWHATYRKYQSYQGSKGLNKVYFYFKPIKNFCQDPTGEVAGNDGDPCAQPFYTDEWVGFRYNH